MSTQYLNHSLGRIAYDDTGSGPLVLCVPSLGDLRQEYRFLVPQLVDAGFRVVTMDMRGLGESSTGWDDYSVAGVGEDMVALLRALDAGPAVIVGTSMAAGAAVWAAADAPEMVAGLALIGPFVRGETSRLSALLYRMLFARPWGPAAWQWYYSSLYPTRKPDDFSAYSAALRANLAEPGRIEVTYRMVTASKAASEARLSQVSAPVMVLMGTKDPDFKAPEVEARWVAEALHGPYAMIEDAGHYPHAEMPEITAAHILDFLGTTLDRHATPAMEVLAHGA
jgi:pimeloyl-ACP methyl ester carboxylesterase